MLDLRNRFGFRGDPFHPLTIRVQPRAQPFDGDRTLQERIPRTVDDSHCATANFVL